MLFYSLDSYIYKGSLIICIMEYLYIYVLSKEVSPSKWIVKEVAPSKWLTIIVISIIFKALHSDFMLFMLFEKLFHNISYHRETFLEIFTPKTSHLGIFVIMIFQDYLRV